MKEKVEIIIAQFNAVVGDMDGNSKRILDVIRDNRSLDTTKLIIFPELALCGYSPEDLLYRRDFANSCNNSVNSLKVKLLS